jgi:hypothetical protein
MARQGRERIVDPQMLEERAVDDLNVFHQQDIENQTQGAVLDQTDQEHQHRADHEIEVLQQITVEKQAIGCRRDADDVDHAGKQLAPERYPLRDRPSPS